MGGQVIVTDHHSIADDNIPQCLVLNPAQPDCGFAGHALAGVGVAFYFAAGLRAMLAKDPEFRERSEQINLKQFLAFVALGTIADVVPLSSTNRILVRAGLEALLDTPFPGLKALLKSSDIHNSAVSTEDIGFLLGPKINAAGRLGESHLAIDLFIQRDPKHAEKLTDTLTSLNEKRKSICLQSLESALNKSNKILIDRDKCLIVEGELHQGVAGIVASRLVDSFGVPVVVFSRKVEPDGKQYLVGSARSVTGVNITQCIRGCADLTIRFGGHEMAAGLTIPPENYESFCSRFKALVRTALSDIVDLKDDSVYDVKIPVETLMSPEYIEYFRLLEPFGPGNMLPIFCDPSATIIDSKKVGKSAEHLQVMIRGKYSNHKGIGFRLGEKLSDIQENPRRNLIYVPTLNRYRGTVSWQIRVIDL
jgi:single-stranded-DNA-specific exonuclease